MSHNNEKITELIQDFALFDDWEERYRYLIDMGRALPHMDEVLKVESNLITGCTSRVWMHTSIKDGTLTFVADSDAHIVRGLIAILYRVYNGIKISDIQGTDIEGAFQTMGLDQNLSPNRRNGFFSMVERIQGLAS